jgi:hypothetical protein
MLRKRNGALLVELEEAKQRIKELELQLKQAGSSVEIKTV